MDGGLIFIENNYKLRHEKNVVDEKVFLRIIANCPEFAGGLIWIFDPNRNKIKLAFMATLNPKQIDWRIKHAKKVYTTIETEEQRKLLLKNVNWIKSVRILLNAFESIGKDLGAPTAVCSTHISKSIMLRLGWQPEKKVFPMRALGGMLMVSSFFIRFVLPGQQSGLFYRDYVKELS
jgi:hypothetical protein